VSWSRPPIFCTRRRYSPNSSSTTSTGSAPNNSLMVSAPGAYFCSWIDGRPHSRAYQRADRQFRPKVCGRGHRHPSVDPLGIGVLAIDAATRTWCLGTSAGSRNSQILDTFFMPAAAWTRVSLPPPKEVSSRKTAETLLPSDVCQIGSVVATPFPSSRHRVGGIGRIYWEASYLEMAEHSAALGNERFVKRRAPRNWLLDHTDFATKQLLLDFVAIYNLTSDTRNRCASPRRARPWSRLYMAAVMIGPVSADNLCKTGIFEDRAGDFRRFHLKFGESGARRRNPMREKPRFSAHSRVF
jgi:hypothetical protein